MAFDKMSYDNKYLKEHTKQVSFRFFLTSDNDILERLDNVSSLPGGKAGYIKRLIREDIKRQDKT